MLKDSQSSVLRLDNVQIKIDREHVTRLGNLLGFGQLFKAFGN